MIPEAVISHATPGRLRIKVASRKGDDAYFSALRARFINFQGVRQVEANALTGSLLVIHDTDLKSVGAFAEQHSLFKLNKSAGAPAFSTNVARAFGDFDRRIKRLTSNELDVGGVAFMTLLVLGIYEIGRGNFAAPAWYTAFWYSLNIFLKSLPHDASGKGE